MAEVPDYYERKGSLFLRSDHMNYGRATLNSNWHQAREAEPKNYDISRNSERNLCKATYDKIGNVTDGSLPKTTYQDHAEQTYLKEDFKEQEVRKSMITLDTVNHANLDRDVGYPKRGYGSVLPRHNPDYNKHHLETTHRADYKLPNPDYQTVPERPPDFPDLSAAFRKCHSQFTDTADFRRPGRNTWQDESGIYANTHYKQEVMKSSNPIPESV
ncbi:protein C9orf135-like [Pecten maximus]|uniref:protein C9orf135-like n=1 Tax=Pecten maximus TaxID=6579 RepID=UPI0014587CD8|nr:protein C9orf135-like [Pecten maximus]